MATEVDTSADFKEQSLGQLIKKARLEQGLTIARVSEAAGIAVGQVHKLENNRVQKINPAHLVALAGPLKVPMFHLFRAAGYPAEQVPLLEPHLVKRLAELSPSALNQITVMLNEWLTDHGPVWAPAVAKPVGYQPSADEERLDAERRDEP